MADRRDPLSALLQPIIEEIARNQTPPYYSYRNRAVAGTWLLVAGVYGAYDVMARYDIDMSDLATALAGHPQGAASALAAPLIWFAIALLGCFWVVDGAPRERSLHSVTGVLWLCVLIGGCTYGLVAGAYLDDFPVASSCLRGFYLATLVASVMEFFLFARCGWDVPEHRLPREHLADRARRSGAVALGRAQLARAVRRGNTGFAQPATSGIL
jgi:hypothetical protein